MRGVYVHCWVILATLVCLSGCAARQTKAPAVETFGAGSRVGVMNRLDEHMTLSHANAVNWYSHKTLESEWRLWPTVAEFIHEYATAEIVDIPEPASMHNKLLYSVWGEDSQKFKKEHKSTIATICKEQNLNALIVFRNKLELQAPHGYGVFASARIVFGNSRFFVHIAGVDVEVIDCDPDVELTWRFREPRFLSTSYLSPSKDPMTVSVEQIPKITALVEELVKLRTYTALLQLEAIEPIADLEAKLVLLEEGECEGFWCYYTGPLL